MLYANGYPVGGGGNGTGGHTIIDENGNSMTARAGLQFVGADVSDDSTNNKTIVDISGGGGVYIEKTLWEDANGLQFAPNNIQTITLSESLNKYDFIYVDVSSVEDSGYHNQNILAVSSLYDENDGYNGTVCIGGNIKHTNSFAKVDNTHLKFIGFSSANPLIVWKVVGIKVSGDYYAPVIYSTEEREIGVWTDGKPLYEKTISIPTSSQNTTYDVSSLDIDTCVKIDAFMSGNGSVPDGYWYSLSNYVSVNYYDGDLFINAPTQYSNNSPCIVTLRYTKSTDTAGSGTWTPQGVPTHHYSTDEQVVGTWIDGKTLYEKTIDFGNLPSSTIKSVDTNVSNIGLVTKVNGFAYSSGATINIPYIEANNTASRQTIDIWHNKSTNKVDINTNFDASGFYGYVTIQYTKSS